MLKNIIHYTQMRPLFTKTAAQFILMKISLESLLFFIKGTLLATFIFVLTKYLARAP